MNEFQTPAKEKKNGGLGLRQCTCSRAIPTHVRAVNVIVTEVGVIVTCNMSDHAGQAS